VRSRSPDRDGARGSVTAELALALPSVVLVLGVVVCVGQVVTAQVRCTDAARAGARLAARGEPAGRVESSALALAPAGSSVSSTSGAGSPGRVAVRVEAVVRLPFPGGASVRVSGEATADSEADPPGAQVNPSGMGGGPAGGRP
jgi:Flp pilus assembly protein TadG